MLSTALASDGSAASAGAGSPSGSAWLSRERRVVILLALIWVLNFFDLCYTLTESNARHFRELNPLAATLLGTPLALVMYKCALVVIGSCILIKYRFNRIVELSCWFVLATYSYVYLRWWLYYEHLVLIQSDPTLDVSTLANVMTR